MWVSGYLVVNVNVGVLIGGVVVVLVVGDVVLLIILYGL